MNYAEKTTGAEFEHKIVIKKFDKQASIRVFNYLKPYQFTLGLLILVLNFGLIYLAFCLSFFLRFNWFNFDNTYLNPTDPGHYLSQGVIYSFVIVVLLLISKPLSRSDGINFIKCVFTIAGIVLTGTVLITFLQLLDQTTIIFSRLVFAFLIPMTWLILTTELSIIILAKKVITTYNNRHRNLVRYAISLDAQYFQKLQANPKPMLFVKRSFDFVGALGILILASIPILILAILIKLDSKGPIIFKQVRVGKKGRYFTFYKFRSMYSDADAKFEDLMQHNETHGATFKMKNDPRVTRVGRFLRRTSLDELPQLVNVLLGQMSLVGPRPGLPREVINYQEWQHRRLEVTPGLTGLWQVSGRSNIGFEEMTKLDIYYIYRCSPWMDMKILAKTAATVLTGNGAY